MAATDIHPKVAVGAAAGALAIILVWAAKQWGNIDMPGEVAAAFGTIFTVVGGYLTPSPPVK